MVLPNQWLRWLRPPLTRSERRRNAAAHRRPRFWPHLEPLEARLVLYDHIWTHGSGFGSQLWTDHHNWSNGSPDGDPDPRGAVVIFPEDTPGGRELNVQDVPGELPIYQMFYHRGGFDTEGAPDGILLSGDIYTDLGGTNTVNVNIDFTPFADDYRHRIQVNADGTLVLSGDLTGEGGFPLLEKQGTGTLVLSGDNGHLAATLVLEQGMVQLGGPAALTGAITTVLLPTPGTVLDLNNFDAAPQFTLDAPVRADIRLGSGTLIFGNGSAADLEDVISGTGGLFIEGDGTQVTLGGQGNFSGPTEIEGGILRVDGASPASPIRVDAAGKLTGGGLVGSMTVYGQLDPGSDVTPTRVVLQSHGNVVFEDGSSFEVGLSSVGSRIATELDVTGAVTLDPGTALLVGASRADVEGATYTILHATDGVQGTFDGLPDGQTFMIGTKRFQIHYSATDVTLTQLPQFLPPVFTRVDRPGGYTWTMVQGDFDGDGIPDIACGAGAGVRLLHGNGDGTFTPLSPDLTVPGPTAVVAGHFHDPNVLDLAVTTSSSGGQVYVFLGNGDGTFQPPVLYAAGVQARAVAVDDVNGDGAQDLVLAGVNGSDGTVSVLLGNGDGSFQDPLTRPLAAGYNPSAVALARLTAGGPLDLMVWGVAGPGPVLRVLPGNGDGTFQDPTFTYQFSYPESSAGGLAVADFNNDGLPDVLVVGSDIGGTGRASVFLGNGDGSLRPPVRGFVGYQPGALAVGDFDGDGNLDLAANTLDGLHVAYGNGDGSFGPPNTYGSVTGSSAIVMADFNGDGGPDLAALGFSSGNVGVLLNAVPRGGPAPHPGGHAPHHAGVLPDVAAAALLAVRSEPAARPLGAVPSTGAASGSPPARLPQVRHVDQLFAPLGHAEMDSGAADLHGGTVASREDVPAWEPDGGLAAFAVVVEGHVSVLEELLLPVVEQSGVDAVLVAEVGHGFLVHEMEAQDGHLLRG